jgi:hypothetical protein
LIELRIEDDGPPLDRASLLEWQELHTVAAPPFFVDANQSQSADCSPEGMTTELKLLFVTARDGMSGQSRRAASHLHLLRNPIQTVYIGEVDIAKPDTVR